MSKELISLSRDIKDICKPYFQHLQLDHLNYIHRDNYGNVTYLCSNQNWLDHYIKKSYPKIGAFEKNVELSKFKFALWNGLDSDDRILNDSKEITGVEYGIAIIKQEEDGVGFYNLGTKSSDPSIVNKYINEINKYESFISVFREKAIDHLRVAKKYKINIFLDPDKTKKPKYRFRNLYLTDREYECVTYLIRGKTAEEIAIILNISRRTIEAHIQNIKIKMNCYNQFRLGYLLGCLGVGL